MDIIIKNDTEKIQTLSSIINENNLKIRDLSADIDILQKKIAPMEDSLNEKKEFGLSQMGSFVLTLKL